MIIYVLLAVFVLILNILYCESEKNNCNKNVSLRYYIVACISIILIVGLRDASVGSDTIVYVHVFEICNETSWSDIIQRSISYRDPGFYIFTKILTYFCFRQVWLYLLIMAFLSCFGIFHLIYKTSLKPVLSLYFWICLTTFLFIQTGMRQAVAMSLCAFSIQFISLKKWYLFIFFILLASTIHHSSFLFLPVILLGYTNFNKKYIVWAIFLMIISHYISQYIFLFANTTLIYNYEMEAIDNGMVYFFILIIINLISYYSHNKWIIMPIHKDIFYIAVFCLVLWNLRLIDRMAERPAMYFMCALPSVLTNSLETGITKEKKHNYIILIISILLSFLLFFKRIYNTEYYFIF